MTRSDNGLVKLLIGYSLFLLVIATAGSFVQDSEALNSEEPTVVEVHTASKEDPPAAGTIRPGAPSQDGPGCRVSPEVPLAVGSGQVGEPYSESLDCREADRPPVRP
jgi:hypothetical protein